jgi:hypothetical protein
MYRVQKEFQRHGDQDLWSCVLQGMRRRASNLEISQMSKLQQVLWQQRPHEDHTLIAIADLCVYDMEGGKPRGLVCPEGYLMDCDV